MRIDYKLYFAPTGSPLRRLSYVILGAIGIFCLLLGLTQQKDSPSVSAKAASNSSTVSIANAKTIQGDNQKQVSKQILSDSKPESKSESNRPLFAGASTVTLPKKLNASPVTNPVINTAATKTEPQKVLNLIGSSPSKDTSNKDNKDTPKVENNAPQLNNESLAEATTNLWQMVKVRQGDTLSSIFSRLGISSKDLHEIMTKGRVVRPLLSLHPGQTLKLKVDDEGTQIANIELQIAPGKTLAVQRTDAGFKVEEKEKPLEKQLAFGGGSIQNSLINSAKRAGLDYKVISQMVEIFGSKIDFALDLRENDKFRVLYEEKYLDGEKIETGNILAVEFINQGEKYQAVRYTDKTGKAGYFSPDGDGLRQGFLRTPVHFARVSSHFGKRNHPILHRVRQHKGVDYSAPKGTSVFATADAKVVFVGSQGGYGKLVKLQHGPRYTTLYAHLSRFAKNIRVGSYVRQGEVIGYVGQTGLATAPHLHYEFQIDGVHRNPLTVALPKQNPLEDLNKRHFLAHAKEMLRLLDLHENNKNVKMAKNEYPHFPFQ